MKAATVLLALLIWFFLLVACYGLRSAVIAFAVVGGLIAFVLLIVVALGRAAKRGDRVDPAREEQPLDEDADLFDTNGETR